MEGGAGLLVTILVTAGTWSACESTELSGPHPLDHYDLPPDAAILVNYLNRPLGIHAQHPRCVAMEEGRKCMNVTQTFPIFEGKNCYGKECLMFVRPGPASCLLKVADPTGNERNKSRQLTCGVDPDDELIIQPTNPVFGPPGSNAKSHIARLPPGVVQKVFFPCVGGELQPVVRLTFNRNMAYNFTCLGNPKCLPEGLSSQIVCYTTEEMFPSGDGRSFSSTGIIVLIMIVAWLMCISY